MHTDPRTRTHVPRRRTMAAALVVSVAVALAGCGSTPTADEPVSTTTATTTATDETTATTVTRDEPTMPTTTATPDGPDLAAIAADAVAAHDLPALAIAHIAPGGAVDVAVAGHRSRDSDVTLSEDAPFHLGSDTKAMTAVLLATFVQEERLDLDAPLATLLPDVTIDERIAASSLRDVLGHRAGLTDDTLDVAALYGATDASAARADAVADALAAPGAPVGEFVYANVNYMLAGLVAERLGGESWEQLLTTRVFDPLGMACGFGAPTGPDVPLGHTATGDVVPDNAPIADNPPALGPAGTVHCPMREWAKFVTAVLAGLQGEDTALLDAATVQHLFDDDSDYVAGWARLDIDGDTVYTHDGSNTLWYARAILVVERDEAVLIATNTGESSAVTAMDTVPQHVIEP